MAELLIAVNPDEDSRLPLLLRVPLGGGDLLFRTSGTWPREKALFAYPVPLDEWPDDPVIVERVRLRSCRRRGAAIDVIADRSRHNRSQLVFTQARGRDVVFWQSPRTRKQARPNVRTPTARAHGIEELQIVVDSHEQYAYRFATQQVTTVKRALPCGDYGIVVDGQLVASVERKSLVDLVASLTGGKLRYQVGDLAALPRAAVVIEDRYSQLFKLDRIRPAVVADGLAELQIRWPNVPVVFCETRQLAEEYTYRFLAAANAWATTEHAAMQRISPIRVDIAHLDQAPAAPTPSTAEVRAWARGTGLPVPDRGRLRPRSGLLGTTPTRRTEPSVYGRVLRSPPDQEAHRSHETRCASNPGWFTTASGNARPSDTHSARLGSAV
ncbi:putative eRCC4 domain protein [Mycobacterium xenopi 4042]|uniref:Putative eRCC4 domain protein n=1 Tax=Mycobacterium xenopi 4042 TaxID=1299334 RepID=X8E6E6_MYCXE|nr:putative eRCC4 domain protein [Mycobacterium xenopi 4042]